MTSTSRSEYVADLVRRSHPSPGRPRMSDEIEARFADIDRDSAAAYAAIDDAIDRLDAIIGVLGKPLNGTNGVVSHDYDDEDSLVHHIEGLHHTTQG